MFFESPQNWTVIDVTLLCVLQQNPLLGAIHRDNFKANTFIPICTSRVEYSSVISEPVALHSCSLFADTSRESEDFAHPSGTLPAVR